MNNATQPAGIDLHTAAANRLLLINWLNNTGVFVNKPPKYNSVWDAKNAGDSGYRFSMRLSSQEVAYLLSKIEENS